MDDPFGKLRGPYKTILADPPWHFSNSTGKVAPGHKRLACYGTMTLDEIKALPVPRIAEKQSHLYLWVPNALILEGLEVMRPGASLTKPTSSGTRFARMADQTDAASASTSATSPN